MFIAKLYSPHRVYSMLSIGKFVLCDMPSTVKMSLMTTEMYIESTASPLAIVYFDGGCPICSREISFYQRQSGADQIAWVDLTTCPDSALPNGVSRQAAMARFTFRRQQVLPTARQVFSRYGGHCPGSVGLAVYSPSHRYRGSWSAATAFSCASDQPANLPIVMSALSETLISRKHHEQ